MQGEQDEPLETAELPDDAHLGESDDAVAVDETESADPTLDAADADEDVAAEEAADEEIVDEEIVEPSAPIDLTQLDDDEVEVDLGLDDAELDALPEPALNGAEPHDGPELAEGPPADALADPDAPADASDPPGADAEPIAVEPWAPPKRRFKWIARILVPLVVAVPAVAIVMVLSHSDDGGADLDPALVGALRYDAKGEPVVLMPAVDVGTVRRRQWRVCGAECDPVSGRGTRFEPGDVLAGSRVELHVVGSKGEQTVKTPNWDGQLKILSRPAMIGDPVVGTEVSATAGQWTGGWVGGEPLLGLRACPTKQGGGKCVAFTASILQGGERARRTIPASFRGWYLGAIEWQVPPGRKASATKPVDPATPKTAQQAPQRSSTVALGPLDGPIR